MTTDIFELQSVEKRYGDSRLQQVLFDDVSLSIPEGDFVAIMGPSGSGKTTLLNLLGGIDRPTSGILRYRSEVLSGYSEARLTRWRARNIGFVFQTYNLMPMLNAYENVALPLMLTSLPRAARARNVELALGLVGLARDALQFPSRMSGGQQQRVAIARAFVADPPVLLCDEPTGNLDRKAACDVLTIFQTLNEQHAKTIVMATHDPVAASFARRVLYIDKGKFVEREAERARVDVD